MHFSHEQNGNVIVVATHVDKLDAVNAPELKALFTHLNKNGHNQIVLDLHETKYCDSTGLSAILIANRLCKDTNGSFALCGLQANVSKMIAVAQLDKVLSISSNKEEALALIQ